MSAPVPAAEAGAPRARPGGVLAALLGLAAALALLGLCVGAQGLDNPFPRLAPGAVADPAAALTQQIVWNIRLPRTLGALAAGVLLGLAGAVAQGLFRNPLADPYLLGGASGASLGVALTLAALGGLAGMLGGAAGEAPVRVSLFSGQWAMRLGLTGGAFAGALLAVALTLVLARGVQQTLRLLLAGVIVGMVLGALSSLALVFSPESLQAMQAFMLGSTAFVGWTACALMLGVAVALGVAATLLARALDLLSLGEVTAQSLGLPLARVRLALVGVVALATATAVAQTGLVAFVGLVAPHLVRGLARVTHRWLVPLAALAGGVLLLAADLLARGLLAPLELPVGVLTAMLGGGYLLWLMHRGGAGRV